MSYRTAGRAGGSQQRFIRASYILLTIGALAFGVATLTSSPASFASPKLPVAPAVSTSQPLVDQLQYGFYMALIGNNSAARDMGFSWVEYGVFWSNEEPSPGDYSWLNGPNNVDNIADGARTANVNLLVRISRTPDWARDPACNSVDTCPPANPADFGNFARALAARVRSRLSGQHVAYEIWNEPNTSYEWGNMCPDPARYTALLRSAYPQIRSADPGATVAGGSVTTVGQVRRDPCPMDDLLFIQGMYNAGAAPYFDVLSDHPYGYTAAPEQSPLTGQNALVFRRAERHHDYMVANGDGSKKIWATEIGWAIDPRTEGQPCQPPDWYFIFNQQQQADYLVRAYQWARSYWPWMGAMFTWNYDFNEASWLSQCDPFRYFSVKGRLAESALRSQALNPPPTYTPVPATATPTVVVDNPPVISAVRYSALNFGRSGGTLTLELDVSDIDSSPVDSVNAVLTMPGGATQLFTLTLISGTLQNGTWRATMDLAVNGGSDPVYYTVSPYAVEAFPPRRTTTAPSQQIMVANTRFWDVLTDYWAYSYIEALAARDVIGGYADASFRPANTATRGQLSKIVVLAFEMPLQSPPVARFEDVPVGSTFFSYVETAAAQGLLGGYPCGGVGEPCDPQNRPYFRPNNPVTRGQIAKIVVLAAGWPLENPPSATFTDVPAGSTFFQYVETAVSHEFLSGYPCGGVGEPCDSHNRPYFRPGNNATRAQIAKIVFLSSFAVATPTPTPSATATSTATSTETATAVATTTTTAQPTLQPKK